MADEFFLKMPDFHVTFRDLLHAVNLRHGTNGFTSLPKEGLLRIFSPWKIRRVRPGLNPRTWVPKASTLPLDHRSRHSKNNRASYGKKKCPVVFLQSTRYSCQIIMEPRLSWQIFQKYILSNFLKVRSMGAELFLADGQTDMTKTLIVAFRNFAKAPRN